MSSIVMLEPNAESDSDLQNCEDWLFIFTGKKSFGLQQSLPSISSFVSLVINLFCLHYWFYFL